MKQIIRLFFLFSIIIGISSFLITANAYSLITPPLYPDADSFVINGSSNWGDETSLWIGTQQSNLSYVKFDITSVPDGSIVDSASLRLYCTIIDINGSVIFARVAETWDEMGVIWSNRPGWALPIVQSTPPGENQYWDIDVTSIVRSWVEDGDDNYGFYLEKAGPNRIICDSREGTYRPILQITYTPPSLPSPDIRISPTSLTVSQNTSSGQGNGASVENEQLALAKRDKRINNSSKTKHQNIAQQFAQGKNYIDVMILLKGYKDYKGKVIANNRAIMATKQASIRSKQRKVLGRLNSSQFQLKHRFENILGFTGRISQGGLQSLIAMPEVELIEEDVKVYLHTAQGVPLMNTSTVRSTYSGSGISVAIVDTGIDYTHPMLGGCIGAGCKVLGGYDFGDKDPNPIDCQGHGSSVAGISAGNETTGQGDYIGGVAHDARLYALKVFPGCNDIGGSFGDIAAAWDWVVSHKNDDSNNPILVINTSIGDNIPHLSSCDADNLESQTLSTAASNAVSNGITLFASSGNNNFTNGINMPACLSDVISVGAVYDDNLGSRGSCTMTDSNRNCISTCTDSSTTADMVTCFSNSANYLDLLAPSYRANTTDINSQYNPFFGGTSAASPYAAGAGAILQSYAISTTGSPYTPDEIKARLVNNGDPIFDSKSSVTTPRVNVSNSLGGIFTIYNDGTSTLTITNMAENASWLSLQPTSPINIDPGNSQIVATAINWNAVSGSGASETIQIYSNDPDENPYPGGVTVTVICSNTYYRDFDGDGYGDLNNPTTACNIPSGYVTNTTDCNDNDSATYPGAVEICDGVDNQCSGDAGYGQTDEGFTEDTDGDGVLNCIDYDPVSFPDANLRASIEQELGVTNPTQADMFSMEELYAPSRGITDLTGIEYGVNLLALSLYENQISDISSLAGITNLYFLYLSSNQISDISALAEFTNLNSLYLSFNQISDISALAGLSTLEGLHLSHNQISDISALVGLTNLEYLQLGFNQISSMPTLSDMTNLNYLGLMSNHIIDITALSGLTNLITLYINNDPNIQDPLHNNQITDISALSGLSTLTNLYLANNCISDFSPVFHVPNVQGMNEQDDSDADGICDSIDTCIDVDGDDYGIGPDISGCIGSITEVDCNDNDPNFTVAIGADDDGDCYPNTSDNCILTANFNQTDDDNDGIGNLCDLDYALVAYYPFNGNADDESLYGNHGVVNGPTLIDDRYGVPSSAFSFDGLDDFITIPAAPHMSFYASDYTVVFWIKSTDNSGYILDERSSLSNGYGYLFESYSNWNTITYTWNSLGGRSGFWNVLDDQWHMLVLVRGGCYFDPTYEYGYTLYEDAVYSGGGCGGLSDIGESNPIFIGGISSIANTLEHYEGIIDDIRIYNRAISEVEIQQLYSDLDGDGILNDGDNNGTLDNPCTGGNIINCDDNCKDTFNPGQQDSDGDGYGNICDCDLDNNSLVESNDYTILGLCWMIDDTNPAWIGNCEHADFDSNNLVESNDYTIMGERWMSGSPWY